MKRKIFTLFVLILILVISLSVFAEDEKDSPTDVFNEVLFYIQNYHIEDQDMDKLMKGAIKGMVDSLDEFSTYMTDEEYEEMMIEFEGHYGGIGIIITPDLTIISPIKDTPGDKIGLKPKDKIIAINDEPTKDMSQSQAVDIMRGEPGTPVNITIEREGKEEPIEYEIIRSDIELPNVESEIKDNRIGYILVRQFIQKTGNDVREAVKKLEAQGAEAIILDLRNNTGGVLTEAVNVSSNFIKEGNVVSAKYSTGEEEEYKVNSSIDAVDLPLVILINQGSASASEIVSGAVKDTNRGTLIGMNTYGKGVIQNVVPLSDDSALSLTTGRYYTPAGHFIHEKGIKPDIKVEYNPDYDGDNQLDRAIEYINKNYLTEDYKEAS
ncbi:MAG: S41 family peptidase [Halothermotrichaceae bacterium]